MGFASPIFQFQTTAYNANCSSSEVRLCAVVVVSVAMVAGGVLQHPYSYREEITRMCRPGNVVGLRRTAVVFNHGDTGWPTCYSHDEHDSGMHRR